MRHVALVLLGGLSLGCGARTGLPGILVEDARADDEGVGDTLVVDAGSDLGFDAHVDTSVDALPIDAALDVLPLCPDGADAGSPLATLREAMIGGWVGVATSPWGTWRLDLTFSSAGTYSAHCLDSGCVAFYYGDDPDSPRKTWELYDIKASGEGTARIDIAFGSTAQRGSLERIYALDGGRRLTFEFFPTWLGRIGPIVYDLRRSCE
ncbi:MAG: hypothetical protein IPJ34_25110 [Myxococcales bacterium]|nr:hypothetical protein [Myxococcales bacterium]